MMKCHDLSQLSEDEKIQRILELEARVEALEANPEPETELNSKQVLTGILEHIPAQVFIKDREGRYLAVSKLAETIIGRTSAELQGKTIHDLVDDPVIADRLETNILTVIKEGKTVQFEETIPFDDGLRTFHSVQFPLVDENSAVYGVCGMSIDVTESYRLKVKQLEQDQHYRTSIGTGFRFCPCQ